MHFHFFPTKIYSCHERIFQFQIVIYKIYFGYSVDLQNNGYLQALELEINDLNFAVL